MQYDVNTPKEYLAALDDDWRRNVLQELREVLLQEAPTLIEDISYKMLGFRDTEGFVFHLNAQKDFVGLYVGSVAAIDPSGELLEGLSKGKGCVRFTKTKSVRQTNIRRFIAQAMVLREAGVRFDC